MGYCSIAFCSCTFCIQYWGYAVDQGIEYAKMVVLYLLMLSVVEDEDTL